MLGGVAFALLATFCFAAGNALEKRGVDQMAAFSARDLPAALRSVASSRWWLAGAAVSVLGLLAQVAAFGRLAISVVQSVGVAGVVALVVVSKLHFGENLHRRELAGIATAVVSVVLVSLSLTKTADSAGVRAGTAPVLVATCATLAVVGGGLASGALRRDARGFGYGAAAGLLYGLSGLGAKGISTFVASRGWFGAVVPLLSSPYPWVFLGCWALGLVVFQAGIQRCRVGVVGPLSSMVGSAFVVAVGTPVFGEHLPASAPLLALRVAGLAGVLAGSALVAWGGPPTAEPAAAMGAGVVE